MFSNIAEFEQDIFFYINKTIKNDLFDLFFSKITYLAEPIAIISLCLLLFVFGKYKARMTAVFILSTSYISYIVSQTIKEIINRPRPLDVYTDISITGSAKLSSFPSTHSVLIASVVTILCAKYKKSSFILIPIALLVGVSRIYLGHHFPSDVLAGFFLGAVISILFLGLENLFNTIQNL
jgi:undecaprenyl-diphosphatase